MQTFLPCPSFHETAKVLDSKRLGKQRVEALQIHNTLIGAASGWRNHPAVKMWRGHVNSLILYHNMCVLEWITRGFRNNMPLLTGGTALHPGWLGDGAFHASHRAALLKKDPDWYGQFGWTEEPKIDYVWPVT